MSDDMMKSGEEPIVPEGTVAPLPAPPLIKPGMARRNVLLIVAGIVVLVALVGFVGWAVFLAGNVATPGGSPVVVTPGGTGTPGVVTPSTPSTANLLPVPDVDNRDIFSPRNPFAPIKPVSIAQPATKDDSNDDTSTAGNNNNTDTLTLEDIVARFGDITITLLIGQGSSQ